MKRLTLEEAIGQTLLAKYEIGEDTLLRFTGGYVTLNTHYESYIIMDYTDGDAPLRRLERFDDITLDALHVTGFIDGHEKFDAQVKREELRQAHEIRKEANMRNEYERLREKFETKNNN
jgi:hypothetical protein